MSKAVVVHVPYESLYISLPSSAQQQCEMSKFFVTWRVWTMTNYFLHIQSELRGGLTYLVWAISETNGHIEQI